MSAQVDPDRTMFVDGANTEHFITQDTKTELFRHKPSNTGGRTFATPVILIHSEFYTAEIWGEKPDGGNGWASDFVKAGFVVFTPTLPLNGAPNEQTLALIRAGGFVRRLPPSLVEKLMTAPAVVKSAQWPSRDFHSQWPGTGRSGDPIFGKLMSATVPIYLDRHEREAAGQQALVDILTRLGKRCVLIGHGSGANLAWLAADMAPEFVAAIIAVEPLGPPFGNARASTAPAPDVTKFTTDFSEPEIRSDLHLPYTPSIKDRPRRYGIADIPLTFNPPPRAPTDDELLDENFQPIPYRLLSGKGPGLYSFVQDVRQGPPRRLVNLARIPQVVWTASASFHTTFDWATVRFLRQAGVDCHHLQPKPETGNGHLCFLEKNSSKISRSLMSWIKDKLYTPKPVAPQSRKDPGQPPNQEKPSQRQPLAQKQPLPSDQSQHRAQSQASTKNQEAAAESQVLAQAQLPHTPSVQVNLTIKRQVSGNTHSQPPTVDGDQSSLTSSPTDKLSKQAKHRGKRGPYKKTLEKRALAAAQAAANAIGTQSNAGDRSQVTAENMGVTVAATFFSNANFEPVAASAPGIPSVTLKSGSTESLTPNSRAHHLLQSQDTIFPAEVSPNLPSLTLGPQLSP